MTLTDHHTHTNDCGCGCGGDCGGGCGCGGSDLVALERTRYFPRQLIEPDDLTQDQVYFREKARRHNRMLHGWGIVCGAGVTGGDEPCKVTVKPGYVLGPYGDEIVIDREVVFDACAEGTAVDPCGGVDPWCSDVRTRRAPGETLYLAIRATECATRPVRVTSCGCGCEDSSCEYSRVRDSFELAALSELPETYADFEDEPSLAGFMRIFQAFSCLGGPRACPPCPSSPWVILADLTLDADNYVTPECAPHRRYVVSFADVSFGCKPGKRTNLESMKYLMGEYAQDTVMVDMDAMVAGGAAPPQPYGAPGAPPPSATVAAKRADGRWMTIPGTFEVKDGDTLATMLAREGDRELADPATGATATLRELYAAAGADPTAPVRTAADALGHLEGRRLDVASLRVVRGAFAEVVDKDGLEHLDVELGGSPAVAGDLPAVTLRGVGPDSAVGKHVAHLTVADVAGESEEAFVGAAIKGLKGGERETETERAHAVWANARRVASLSEAWDG